LVDAGNTVILIEHNLDVIKNSDWVIDLGPGAGDSGGKLIATGTPEKLAKMSRSLTGRYIKDALKKNALKAANTQNGAAPEPVPGDETPQAPKKRRAATSKKPRELAAAAAGD
jgi:hypothetical protein